MKKEDFVLSRADKILNDFARLVVKIIMDYELFADKKTREEGWKYLENILPKDSLKSLQVMEEKESVNSLISIFVLLHINPDTAKNSWTFLSKLIQQQPPASRTIELLRDMNVPNDIKEIRESSIDAEEKKEETTGLTNFSFLIQASRLNRRLPNPSENHFTPEFG